MKQAKGSTRQAKVPDEVLEIAREVLSRMEAFGIVKTSERKSLAERLLEDPRMASLWKLILRSRIDGEYAYPVRPEALNPFSKGMLEHFRRESALLARVGDEASSRESQWLAEQIKLQEQKSLFVDQNIRRLTPQQRQGWACRSVYMAAFSAGAFRREVTTIAEIARSVQAKQVVAEYLKESAAIASDMIEQKVDVEAAVARLKKEARLELLRNGDDRLVDRQRGDAMLRGLAFSLRSTMLDHFGTPFYGQIAKISNVILKRDDITLSRIREMLRP